MPNPKSPKSVAAIATIILLAAGSARSFENDPNESGLTMEFVRIPAGSFYITPTHHVQFTKPFYMGKYEVTQAQWKAVMGTTVNQQHKKANSCWHLKGVGPEYPIYYVSWEEAAEFCKKLGSNFRLPAETEWEYACRAGSKTRFHYGNDPDYSQLDSYAWYYDNSKGSTQPVGQKKPNGWGLYDMYGNVSEWCSENICRGGNWIKRANKCHSSSRYSSDRPRDLLGFRVVFTGNIDSNKKVLKITLPKWTTDPNTASEKKQEIKSAARMAIKGLVRNVAGIPVDDIDIAITPWPNDWDLRSYPEGSFEAYQYDNYNSSLASRRNFHLYARHKEQNLVACVEFNEDVNMLDIKLQPGAILTCKVVDANGKAIHGTEISLHSSDCQIRPIHVTLKSDTEGKFEIKGLPLGHKYGVTARATGYCVNTIEFQTTEMPESRIEIDPIVMARGQFSVSGVVLDRKRKPVADATVQCFIKEPVNIHTQTDEKGRFTAYGIFEGPVFISSYKKDSSGTLWYGQKHTQAGATNVKVVLRQKTNYGRRE